MRNAAFSVEAERGNIKAANQQVKEAVQRLYPFVKVTPTSQVMHCEDGAFVEVMIWLPTEDFQPGIYVNKDGSGITLRGQLVIEEGKINQS
jgi:hypothetical protein